MSEPRVEFDADTHTYKVGGEVWPSVTQILKDEGLIDTRFYNTEARDRGSMVADAIEYANQNDLDESSLDPQLRGYVEAWRKWCRDFRVEIVESEKIVWHEGMRYCGKADAIVRAITVTCNAEIIIDAKTGGSEFWHPYQLIAYKRCLPDPTMQRGNVYLRDDGKYTCRWHGIGEDRHDWQIFEAAALLWWEKERRGLNPKQEEDR
jgi:hypothetical protein